MTTFDILRAEAHVTNTITLHHEGMFWRAYERSAYLFCTQIKELKVTKKEFKMMYRTTLVFIGFPEKSLEKFMARFRLVAKEEKTLTYEGFQPLDENEFKLWREHAGFDLIKTSILGEKLSIEIPGQAGNDGRSQAGNDGKGRDARSEPGMTPQHTVMADTHTVMADTHTVMADTSTVMADTSTVMADTHTVMADLIGHLGNDGQKLPYFQVPVFRTVRRLYDKMAASKVLESIPKAMKKRMVEPALQDLWEVQVDVFEVRELEKQITNENGALHSNARKLLLEARRKVARVIVAVRTLYEIRVHGTDLGMLIPKNLYEDYSQDLVSIYKQLGCWINKHNA